MGNREVVPAARDPGRECQRHIYVNGLTGRRTIVPVDPVAGEEGVREVIANLLADFDLTLGLAGCTSVDQVRLDTLIRAGEVPAGDGR